MRKMIAAVSVGLLLVAGQAAAAGSNPATVRVGDRVGSSASGGDDLFGIPTLTLVMAAVIGGFVIATLADTGDTIEN